MYKYKKKIAAILLLGISLQIFSAEQDSTKKYYGNNFSTISSNWIFEKSMSSVRQSILLNPMMRTGQSYSVQSMDFFVADGNNNPVKNYNSYDTDSAGVIFVTTSQFARTENSAWIAGVGYGYIRSEINYDNISKTEYGNNTGLNVFLGYNKNNFLVHGIINSAYSDIHNVTENGYDNEDISFALELGKIFTFAKNYYAYPYANIDYKKIALGGYEINKIKYEQVIDESIYYNLGFLFSADWEKFYVKGAFNYSQAINIADTKRNNSLESYPVDSEKIYSYSVSVGYYFWEDILITLENNGKFGDFYSTQVYGTRVRYTF